ncbi:acylphosphatase [Candidatus Peregrinibacteria bacterium]|nr:acylphosphatase [Candidatus Peregrinibacteria bacterium]
MKIQAVLTITGKVQGVCYRANAQTHAQKLSLTGWVRNMPDGSVKVVCQGEPSSIESFVTWCKQGPPAASVRSVNVKKQPLEDEKLFDSFDITG